MKYFVQYKGGGLQETTQVKYYSLRRQKKHREQVNYNGGYKVSRCLYLERA